ncbi:hypothetical protein TIFTF001_015045 [Ficus carica]|uniref:Uncharacterized protein n=1 Tax=Ficus carica TaxID=3494 RepID=A0AA88D4S3_FICCA|nr:hypothetical protein TIFTF001_015045 [Ficus carica]
MKFSSFLLAGNFISLGLFLSPIPTFVKIWKEKSVQDFKPDPYVATILNCAMWCFYGLPFVHPDSLLVITINGTGFLIELVFVSIFIAFAPWPTRKRILLILVGEVAFMVVVAFVTLQFLHTTRDRSMIVGIICIIFNILMYVSPLTVMIPNGLGAISGLIQLVLYCTYYKTTQWDTDDDRKSHSEVQLSNV